MTRQRVLTLSKSFEALLGKTHKYGYVDRELVERYVCLGDPDEIAENPKALQGRFSDITKSADIWLDVPELGSSLLLRDTPGINDTFMVREQITLRALRGSKVCVVVLSAHEALNTTDLALVRLISNYEQRQVILFVNRIDELARPGEQVPEIRESILATVKSLKAGRNACVLFGSARWAEMALTGDYSRLEADPDARAALEDWSRNSGIAPDADRNSFVWKLSGVPSLMHEINLRIVEQSGRRHLDTIRTALQNLTNEIAAKEALAASRQAAERLASLDVAALRGELDQLCSRAQSELDRSIQGLEAELVPSLNQVQDDFVARATEALVEHLRRNKGDPAWTFNSSGLRLVLRTTYDRFASKAKAEVERVFHDAAEAINRVYIDSLGVTLEGFLIEPPQAPKVPPPVELGKTIAIDLGGAWWKRWMQRRRSHEDQAQEYAGLIEAEIASMIQDLRANQLAEVFAEMRQALAEFLLDQTETILGLVSSASIYDASVKAEGGSEQDIGFMLKSALGAMKDNMGADAFDDPDYSQTSVAVGA